MKRIYNLLTAIIITVAVFGQNATNELFPSGVFTSPKLRNQTRTVPLQPRRSYKVGSAETPHARLDSITFDYQKVIFEYDTNGNFKKIISSSDFSKSESTYNSSGNITKDSSSNWTPLTLQWLPSSIVC